MNRISSYTQLFRLAGKHLGADASLLPRLSLASSNTSSQNLILSSRSFQTSQPSYLKEIEIKSEGNTTIIDGKYIPSPREGSVLENPLKDENVCILCALKLNLKHTDVMVLSQFVRPDGRLLPQRVTGLCGPQQRKLTLLVTMAKKAGLMPNLAPANSHKDPTKRRGSKKFNRYFDEDTIRDTRLRNIIRFNNKIGVFGTPLPEELE